MSSFASLHPPNEVLFDASPQPDDGHESDLSSQPNSPGRQDEEDDDSSVEEAAVPVMPRLPARSGFSRHALDLRMRSEEWESSVQPSRRSRSVKDVASQQQPHLERTLSMPPMTRTRMVVTPDRMSDPWDIVETPTDEVPRSLEETDEQALGEFQDPSAVPLESLSDSDPAPIDEALPMDEAVSPASPVAALKAPLHEPDAPEAYRDPSEVQLESASDSDPAPIDEEPIPAPRIQSPMMPAMPLIQMPADVPLDEALSDVQSLDALSDASFGGVLPPPRISEPRVEGGAHYAESEASYESDPLAAVMNPRELAALGAEAFSTAQHSFNWMANQLVPQQLESVAATALASEAANCGWAAHKSPPRLENAAPALEPASSPSSQQEWWLERELKKRQALEFPTFESDPGRIPLANEPREEDEPGQILLDPIEKTADLEADEEPGPIPSTMPAKTQIPVQRAREPPIEAPASPERGAQEPAGASPMSSPLARNSAPTPVRRDAVPIPAPVHSEEKKSADDVLQEPPKLRRAKTPPREEPPTIESRVSFETPVDPWRAELLENPNSFDSGPKIVSSTSHSSGILSSQPSTDSEQRQAMDPDSYTDGRPLRFELINSDIGIPKGDVMLSLLNEYAETPWSTRVHEAVWRCRTMRQNNDTRWLTEKAERERSPQDPVMQFRNAAPVDVDDDRVLGEIGKSNLAQKTAVAHLKFDELDQALSLFEDIIVSHYNYLEQLMKSSQYASKEEVSKHVAEFKPFIGTALHNLGVAHLMRGEHDKAFTYFERAVMNRAACLGPGHPDHIASVTKLAVCQLAVDKIEDAKQSMEGALELYNGTRRSIAESRQFAELLNNLGCMCYAEGRIEKARNLFTESMKIQESIAAKSLYSGSKFSCQTTALNMSVSRGNVGFLNFVSKDVEGSIADWETAAKDQLLLLRDAHPTLIATLDHLAAANVSAGRKLRAQQLLQRMHNMQIDAFGPSDLRCMTTYNKMQSLHARDSRDRTPREGDSNRSKSEKGPRNVLKRFTSLRRKK